MLLKSLLLFSAALAAAESPVDKEQQSGSFSAFENNPDFIPGRFIVEFSDPQGLSKRSLDSDPATAFTDLLNVNGVSARPAYRFTSQKLFVGASFDASSSTFSSDSDILQHLRTLPDVKRAWPVRRITTTAETPGSQGLSTNDNSDSKTGFVDSNKDTKFHSDSSYHFSAWSPHSLTGVDALHSRGITGKNVTIGIVDSGTFYYDSALGGGYGPGYKVSGGWNFMGSAYDPSVQGFAVPNNNTLDCLGHGTHVAGIAAASANSQFVGVAPDANIKSYRVFGCTESTSEDVVMAAIERAYTDGCDVINLSVGADGGGYQNNPISTVIDKVSKNGVFVVASAGNSGSYGAFNGNQDATGDLVTSVGATDTGLLIGYEAEAQASNGDSFRFTYIAPKGVQPNMTAGSYELTVATQDACTLGDSAPKGSSDKAVIFPQGECVGYKFYEATHNLGFKLVVSYNQDFDLPTSSPPQYLEDTIFRIQAERDLGDWVSRQTSQGQTVKLAFTNESFVPRSLLNTNNVGSAYYSSQGPDYSGNLYPLISAPGTGIFSTYLNNTFAQLDGTSMAAPYITGIYALYLQSIGGRPSNVENFVANAQHKLVHTANSIKAGIAPLIKAGAGLVNATSFIDTKSYFGSSALNLGLNPDETKISVTLYNDNDNSVNYKLSHIGVPTVLSKSGPRGVILQSLPLVYDYASVDFGSESVQVAGKSSVTINVSFKLPTSIDSSFAPIFQGKLQAESDNGEKIAVPYTATVTDDFKVWTESRHPLFFYNVNDNKVIGGANYSATKEKYTGTPSDDSIPWINVSYNSYFYSPVLTGAQVLNLAVVAENFTQYDLSLPLKPGKNGVLGFISGFPVSMYPRTQGGLYGRISTPGIPTGKYRLLSLSLPAIPNVSFNSTNPEDWDMFLTDPFGFSSTSTVPSGGSYSQTSAFGSGVSANLGGIITYIGTVRSASTNSSVGISPYDTLRIAIPFRALNGFKLGSSFSIQLPKELTDFPSNFKVLNTKGDEILDVVIKDNSLTASCITASNQTYISGALAFGAKLKNPSQYLNSQLTQLPLIFQSDNYAKGFAPNVLDISPYDSQVPSLVEEYNSDKRSANVYIPPSFNNWSNLTLNVKTARIDVSCGSVSAHTGTNLTSSVDSMESFSGASVSCNGVSSRQFSVSLGNAPSDNKGTRVVLPLNIPSNQNVAVEGGVEVTLVGSLNGNSFEYKLERWIIGNSYVDRSTPLTGSKQ